VILFVVALWWQWSETGRRNCSSGWHQPSQKGSLLENTFKPLVHF